MITLFTAPKPFIGNIDIIQRNALRSWTLLDPECEIILFGDEQGTAEIAPELGMRQISEVKCNEYGTPLISDIFEVAQKQARHNIICYVNADLILMGDFMNAVTRVVRRKKRFLMVGQRWNLDITEPIDFESDWEKSLIARLTHSGQLESPNGIDFFVFRRGMFEEVLPFVVGRPCWDNWLIYRARELRIPVIDLTGVLSVIHQNHDYSHVPKGTGKAWHGPEADYNRELLGSWDRLFTILDATHLLTSSGLIPALGFAHLRRRCQQLPALFPVIKPIIQRIGKLRKQLSRSNG
jgi:hypothetical protein